MVSALFVPGIDSLDLKPLSCSVAYAANARLVPQGVLLA
jgi:hypothetical protein